MAQTERHHELVGRLRSSDADGQDGDLPEELLYLGQLCVIATARYQLHGRNDADVDTPFSLLCSQERNSIWHTPRSINEDVGIR